MVVKAWSNLEQKALFPNRESRDTVELLPQCQQNLFSLGQLFILQVWDTDT